MIKHASDDAAPILTARERVERAVLKITNKHLFNEEQLGWLAYIKEHLIENLAIAESDFEIMPVFERHGSLSKARLIFGDDLQSLLYEINEALAA